MKGIFKKLFTISFLTMAGALALVSQVQAQGGKVWSIGPEVGVNFSKYGRDAGPNDLKTGIVAGFFVTHSIVNNFGITAKFLLSQRGAQYATPSAPNVTTKQTLNYLEVPILGRFFLTSQGKFRPNLFVGPSFNFLLSGTNKVGDTDPGFTKENYNSFDFGLTGGLGLNFAIADETRILLDARYVYGLSNINKIASNPNSNNQTINVSLGVQFGF